MTLNALSLSTVLPRDPGQLLILRHGDREPVAMIHVKHHVHIGASVAHVDHPIRRHAQPVRELVEDRDLAITRRHPSDLPHLSRLVVVFELGAEDVLRRHDVGEGRFDHFTRRRGDDEERKATAVQAAVQKGHQRRNAAAQADAASGFNEVLAPHASKFGSCLMR